jgi:hypothetical protein
MTPYDLRDSQREIKPLVIVDGDESVLGDIAIAAIVERFLPPDVRALNLDHIDVLSQDALSALESAMSALPFLASNRVIVLRNVNTLLTAPRTTLAALINSLPLGNILVVDDIEIEKKTGKRPTPLALNDATLVSAIATPAMRKRYVQDWATNNNLVLASELVANLANSTDPLRTIETTLDKASLDDGPITLVAYQRESHESADIKGYLFGAALMSGRTAEALRMAIAYFANDPRASAIPLISGLANECTYLCEVSRPGGVLPSSAKWRERELSAIARRIGAKCARTCLDLALEGFAAVVSGRASDGRGIIESISVACSNQLTKAPSR